MTADDTGKSEQVPTKFVLEVGSFWCLTIRSANMAHPWKLGLVVWSWTLASYAFAASTPQEVLVEMVLAKDAATIEKHLPTAFVQAVQRLREPHRSKLRSHFVFSNTLPKDAQITIGGGDNLLLSAEWKEESQSHRMQVKVEDEMTSSSGSLLKLGCCQNSDCETYYVQMKFEDGDWRLTRIDAVSKVFDLEASVLLREMQDEDAAHSSSRNEAAAIGVLRTINVALIQYQANYPEFGYPQKLEFLGLPNDAEPTPEHAGLLDSSIACPTAPCRRSGYLFDYDPHLHSDGAYRVTARPEEFGRTGARSFYTDESGVIRFTEENRAATEDDPPLS